MANCDITAGRLNEECQEARAGVKTVFFFKHSQLQVTKNLGGEIIGIGAGTIFRFEQDQHHGLAVQEINRNGETQYLKQQIDFTLFFVSSQFIQTINYLKAGNWAIFFLDYRDKIRLMGEFTPMYQNGFQEQQGTGADGSQYSNLSFAGMSDRYAPFLEDYTDDPFDNFPLVDVIPRYDNLPGLILQNNTGDYIKADNYGNRLDWN